MKRAIDDCGRVLAAWAVGLTIEHVVVGLAQRDEIAGAWELWPARTAAAPIFLGAALLLAIATVGLSRLEALDDPRLIQALAALGGLGVGLGVGTGRHFSNPAMRAVLAIGVAVASVVATAAYRSLKRKRPRGALGALVVIALLAWWADAHVLVRLYPAFHAGLFALALVASGFAAIDAAILPNVAARAMVGIAIACAAYAPFAAKRLRGYDNLRRVLVESAPWMGRAVRIATLLAPATENETALAGPRETKRALDWTNHDVVLVSIDALRADHVGAYGYARPTTPNIDALARAGTIFRHAYCPTPHTSYSVTSMMTGKYLRPLLALGLGTDSETLASSLRRYGYRTAAFYPPAVFFIDQPRFESFEQRALDFEYRKVEFADPELRDKQLREYLATAPADKSLLLWVHFFEPHEPYVQHAGHRFGDTDVDAYDSEIAAADDGVGRVVAAVRETRPGAIVIVTADHGEEFGDHGGRYHGTTVYEEQVRVPLVIVGQGVRVGSVDVPVQTIDLLPTVLSALGIPGLARVRGRDLGPLLTAPAAANDEGFAFAETDDYSLLAKRSLRLVCEKQADACSLYDIESDAAEKHDVSRARTADVSAMRGELAAIERSHGRFEGKGSALPEALRRGAAGDAAAAEEVAGMLDDVNVTYRREAAHILFDLRSGKPIAQLRRARDHDDDPFVRGMCAAAAVRVDKSEDLAPAKALLTSADVILRRRAALALVERDDLAGADVLVSWLESVDPDFARQREIIEALAHAKARTAVPELIALLDDVRLRSEAATALAALGDPAARQPLLEHFSTENYVGARSREGAALVALGAGKEMFPSLVRFAGLPEPMEGAIALAHAAHLLDAAHGGAAFQEADVGTTLRAPAGPLRVGVLLDKPGSVVLEVDGAVLPTTEGAEIWAALPTHGDAIAIHARAANSTVLGVWLVPLARGPLFD